MKGWAFYHQGKYAEAIEAFNESLKSSPDNPLFLRGRGWAYSQTGRYAQAVDDLAAALARTDPAVDADGLEEALRGLSWSHYHRGVIDSDTAAITRALQHFERLLADAVRLGRRQLEPCRGLGWSHYRLGSFKQAKEWFSRALTAAAQGDGALVEEIRRGLEAAERMEADGWRSSSRAPVPVVQSKHLRTHGPLTELELPELIEIEPTFTCNFRCIQCHVSYQKLEHTMLDVDFKKRFRGLRDRWALIGTNYEPTVNPKFAEMACALSDLGMRMELQTNGSMFTEELSRRIKDCNFVNVVLSFDGIRKETYESIRRHASFDRTVERILRFKQTLANRDAFFAVNNVLMRRNVEEIVPAVEFWEKAGFDHLGFIAMVLRDLNETLKAETLEPVMDRVYCELEKAARLVIEKDLKITLSGSGFSYLPRLKELFPANFSGGCVKSKNPAARTPINPRTFYQLGSYPGMHVQCRSPFKSARIQHNGDVELCYQFVVGNIHEKDFIDIWRGEKAQRVRRRVLESRKICDACDYYTLCIKAGEVDYDSPQSFTQAPYSASASRKYQAPTFLERRGCYNLVAWLDAFYAVPVSAGTVRLGVDDTEALESSGAILRSSSLEALRGTVSAAVPSGGRLYGTLKTLGLDQAARVALFRLKKWRD